MKVSIEHSEEKRGLFKKKTVHRVTYHVEFNEKEMHVIDQNDMKKDTSSIVSGYRSLETGNDWDVTIKELCSKKPWGFVVATPVEAKNFDDDLKAGLRNLKDYLEDNMEVESKSTTFEL